MLKVMLNSRLNVLPRIFVNFLLFLSVSMSHGQVVINELMASNDTTIFDEQGQFDDWLELYNITENSIDVSGMHLTDDLSILTKWTIPEGTEIPALGFLLIWADGNEEDGLHHTNFRLSSSGEHLALVSVDGNTIIDDISFSTQMADISYGRFPDGGDNWYFLTIPSPDFENYESEMTGISPPPIFSNPAGFYSDNFLLELSSETTEGLTYYTRDGSIPTPDDNQYTVPFSVFIEEDSVEVIKARTFNDGLFPSGIVTNTYLLNPTFNLPVVSLSTDPENFFDDEIGIYVSGHEAQENFPYWGANFWSDCPHSDRRGYNCETWERLIHFEFFEPDGYRGFGMDAGARIHGHWMRGLPQKTLAIIARDEYGFSEINYPMFPNVPINEFQAILLRSSGNDWSSTMIRDALASTLGETRDLDVMAYRPSILFINGEYWGIHNIREKINEHYVQSHHGVPLTGMDIIENSYGTWPNYGNMEAYDDLTSFLNGNDMTRSENYAHVAGIVDIDELINYTILEVYAANWDWIGGNCKRWYSPGRKWRWILNDLDAAFNQYPGQMRPPEEDMFANNSLNGFREYRKLKVNEQFQTKFINAFADHLNTIFVPEYIHSVVDSLKAIIEPEMPRHIQRWENTFIPGVEWIGDGINSMSEWDEELQRLYDFATIRESLAWGFIEDEFGLNGNSMLELTRNNNGGSIQLNTLRLDTFPWQGRYFNGLPLELIAHPHSNYTFSNWIVNGEYYDSNPILVTPTESLTIQAVFSYNSSAGSNENSIVINEINYSSENTFDPGDWVELHNHCDSTVDISNWTFLDGDDSHVFTIPSYTMLLPDEYLVICRDSVQFKSIFPYVDKVIGNMGFGFSSSGELLRLRDATPERAYIDTVLYDDQAPWPTEPDGEGPTLALKNPHLDNTMAENWAASFGHGTPGMINDVYTGIERVGESSLLPDQVALNQNYPNPFNSSTKLNFSLPEDSFVSIKIVDMAGRYIATVIEGQTQAGRHETEWNGLSDHNLPIESGIYFCQLRAGSESITIKMILLK